MIIHKKPKLQETGNLHTSGMGQLLTYRFQFLICILLCGSSALTYCKRVKETRTCEWVHVTEATSHLLVKLYLGWSNIKEDSGRKEGGRKGRSGGKRKKEHLNSPQISFRPKQSGRWNQADLLMQKAHTRPPGTLLSALSSRPVVTMWLKLPAETSTVEKNSMT